MKNIYKALANFQRECPVIHRSSQGYGYEFTNLTQIFKVIMPLLKKHGLGFTQLMEGTSLKTILFHVESGEKLESIAEIPQNVTLAKMNAYQVLGSAITYFRRYELTAMLGLITEKDLDACTQLTISFVSEDQIKQLRDKMASTKTDEAKFLQYLKVARLEDLQEKYFNMAMSALQQKEK